ncbi:MAG: hypothetical protein EXS35_05645 [Pedosphaera sp.]|nr:hypothetical protein [Pedosphaera sp.]
MKRLSAIVLSLLLFWAQVVVMAQPSGGAKRAGGCCECKAPCCVAKTSSAPQPQPAAASPSVQFHLNLFALTASTAWLLPRAEAEVFASAASSSVTAARVPLFQRDCARLI